MSVVATPTNSFLIPLSSDPQEFNITLGGIEYLMTVKWNDQLDGGWVLDIADSSGVPIVTNIPFVTGTDLLDGLSYLGIPGSLYVFTKGASPFDVPTFTNLGVESNLYFASGAS